MPVSKYKVLLFMMASIQTLLLAYFFVIMYPIYYQRQHGVLAKRDLSRNCNEDDKILASGDTQSRFVKTSKELDDSSQRDLHEPSFRLTRDSEDNNNRHDSARNITGDQGKDKPRLFVAIVSAQNYTNRRQAIRETWMQECDAERNVICKFFTDALDERGDPIEQSAMDRLEDESAKNRNDLIVLDTPSGINFALRLLALMEWAMDNVAFDFLLRVDDDNFLCLDRLIEELPFRPRKRLYWGYLHCARGLVRIDEGMMILTEDLVSEFLRDKDKLLCHKFGDQAVAMWIYQSMERQPVTWFGDSRIHHDPPASYIRDFKRREEICHTFLSLHGTYPKDMEFFQKISEWERRNFGTVYDIPPVADTCPYERKHFYWNLMRGKYFATPVPCKDEPTWVRASSYVGRQNR